LIFFIDNNELLKYFISMQAKLTDLEKAVSRTVRHLAEVQKQARKEPSTPRGKEASSPSTAALSQSLSDLSLENRRLRDERKDLRKRVRTIIKEIDKVKW